MLRGALWMCLQFNQNLIWQYSLIFLILIKLYKVNITSILTQRVTTDLQHFACCSWANIYTKCCDILLILYRCQSKHTQTLQSKHRCNHCNTISTGILIDFLCWICFPQTGIRCNKIGNWILNFWDSSFK